MENKVNHKVVYKLVKSKEIKMKFKIATQPDDDVSVETRIQFNGRIWIGDPCYVIPDKEWLTFLDVLWSASDEDGVVINTPKGNFFVWGTAYGDGEYPVERSSENIGSCGVDSGLLCVMYYDTAYKLLKNKKELARLGCIVDDVSGFAEEEFGNLELGDISVNTRD